MIKIDVSTWKSFKIGDLFNLKKCKCGCAGDLTDGNETLYIGAKKSHNGFMKEVMIEDSLMSDGNCIVFICDGEGSVGYTIYMDRDFIGSTTLMAGHNSHLNEYNGLFLVTVFDLEKVRYSYGRKYVPTLSNTIVKLPADGNGEPDWDFMEKYMKSLRNNSLVTKNKIKNAEISAENWKYFKFRDIFVIKKGFYNKKPEHTCEGNIPFLGASCTNNGVTENYSLEEIESSTKTGDGKNAPLNEKLFPKNAVCVTNNGSVGFAYFQDKEFTCSHDVNPLYKKNGEFNKYTGLFIASVIMKDRYRWCYGRKWRPERMVYSKIKLPCTKDGEPDWDFMEEFIKKIPYSDLL